MEPLIETRLETRTVLYPTLRHLVRFLPWDYKRVASYLKEEAKHNPFLVESSSSQLGRRDLLGDILPEWYEPTAQGLSLQEHLSGQISALSLPSRQREALIYLTQWLSNSGYLEATTEDVAQGSVWSAKELEAVVPILQSLDPPGIGARSLQECLLLQLKDRPQSLALIMVRDYLAELATCTGTSQQARQNRQALLQKLRERHELQLNLDLESAIGEIQELEPRPARNFGYSNAQIITPDLKAEPQIGSWQVTLTCEVEQQFCLNLEAINLLTTGRSRDTEGLEALLNRAKSLLTALSQWQENLLKVGQFLVERQQAFLNNQDKLDLVPTPQQLIAQAVGLSSATVSRIVRGRYLLVTDRTIPLSSLCVPVRVEGRTPQQVQQLLTQLIQAESPTHPYSDEQLAQLLKLRFGLQIARRTVTKYRQSIGLDSSFKRK